MKYATRVLVAGAVLASFVVTFVVTFVTRATAFEGTTAEAGYVAREVAAYIDTVRAEELELAIAEQLAAAEAYVASVRAAQNAAAAAARRIATASPANRGSSGGHSDAWWRGIATCEEGGRNDPYYGFFGKIDGAWAGLSWDEQVARANALLAQAGAERLSQHGPWADHSVDCAYAASPGG